MLRQAYANECRHISGGKQRAVFKNRPSEFFRNSDGSYFRRIDYEYTVFDFDMVNAKPDAILSQLTVWEP